MKVMKYLEPPNDATSRGPLRSEWTSSKICDARDNDLFGIGVRWPFPRTHPSHGISPDLLFLISTPVITFWLTILMMVIGSTWANRLCHTSIVADTRARDVV